MHKTIFYKILNHLYKSAYVALNGPDGDAIGRCLAVPIVAPARNTAVAPKRERVPMYSPLCPHCLSCGSCTGIVERVNDAHPSLALLLEQVKGQMHALTLTLVVVLPPPPIATTEDWTSGDAPRQYVHPMSKFTPAIRAHCVIAPASCDVRWSTSAMRPSRRLST